ncbi:hypothetical protein L6452_42168 [Arctium lappa]|uniref:Uncharacterized protein n=1 Tax=Arctium lappa TaxID=4217 RepID=A0ACB8XHX2_ARCLA|nr:hypothetical protein L6452_42168 [Arctium lappa]
MLLRGCWRFDREIYFPLPSAKDREAILSLHTHKWPTLVDGSLLKLIARRTVGFAGADQQDLCTQTTIIALKRCPWEKLISVVEEKASFASLSKAAATIKIVIVSALVRKKENSNCWWSRVQDLLKEADVASDVESDLIRVNVLVGNNTFSGLDAFEDDTCNEGMKKSGPSK